MDIIYEPKGKAGEYAKLALNIYKGCTHRCRYCFAPGSLRISSEQYFRGPQPKTDVVNRVRKDCEKLVRSGDKVPEILISFLGDPYCPEEADLMITRSVIEILIEYGLNFTILTKGGTRAVRDFDLLEGYGKARFGTSLVWITQSLADQWEPGAASIKDRLSAISEAFVRGIPTWVSLEPVISPKESLQVIRFLHPWVDHWKIGKLNYNPEVEASVDWRTFRESVCDLFNSGNSDFYLKKSLAEL